MPKIRRVRSVSYDRSSRSSPYPDNSSKPSEQLSLLGHAKEWEEARCPICIEHPHNAVLLKCSSHDKGCRPYMCNTSYRHSNCLDQFRKSLGPYSSSSMLREIPPERSTDNLEASLFLACPLCRGELFGYVVVGPARAFMNEKARTCSKESCDFVGDYSKLRRHARSDHPSVRPSEVDPDRQHEWVRLERERDLDDVLSLVQTETTGDDSDDNPAGDRMTTDDFNLWVSSFFASVFQSIEMMLASRLINPEDRDSSRGQRSERTQSQRPHREDSRANNRLRWRQENYHAPSSSHQQRNNGSSSSQARSRQHPRWRNQRWYHQQR